MQAWILDESPGSYRFGEIATPEPGPAEVRVRVVASALNHMDTWGTRARPSPTPRHGPGPEGAAGVQSTGAGAPHAPPAAEGR